MRARDNGGVVCACVGGVQLTALAGEGDIYKGLEDRTSLVGWITDLNLASRRDLN